MDFYLLLIILSLVILLLVKFLLIIHFYIKEWYEANVAYFLGGDLFFFLSIHLKSR